LLIAYKNIVCAVENFSIATVYGLYYFGRGNLGTESFSMFVRYDSLAQNYFMAIQHFSLLIYEEYQRFQHIFPLFHNMTLRYLTKRSQKNEFIPVLSYFSDLSSNCRRNFLFLVYARCSVQNFIYNYGL
jgi:hypothetical protein